VGIPERRRDPSREGAEARARQVARLRALVEARLAGTGARVLLFGSEARGSARPSSDVDLAVEIDAPERRRVLARLREEVEESTIPLTVEIVDLAEVGAALRAEIEREGIRWI